jgi:hypothetical protein
MTKIEQLQFIRKDLFHGELGTLATLSKVNRGVLSNYLKNCDRIVLRVQVVDNILNGYEKFKKEHR